MDLNIDMGLLVIGWLSPGFHTGNQLYIGFDMNTGIVGAQLTHEQFDKVDPLVKIIELEHNLEQKSSLVPA